MADPWEIPPFPDHGDATEAITHIARSRALDEWELLEVALGFLDSRMARAAGSRIRYGSGQIFVKRLAIVEENARRFFVRYPNQAKEGDFDVLLCHIRAYSQRRHDIAHGVVQPLGIRNIEGVEFGFLPAPYTIDKERSVGFPKYIYNSELMNSFRDKFREFWHRITALEHLLFLS